MEDRENNRDLVESKILIVDDMPANVLLLQKILQLNGYEHLRTLTDSREVLDTYISYKPDLMLLDLSMPYLDGLEVMVKLSEIDGDDVTPIIIISAQDDRQTRLKGYKLGAKDFITKPIDNVEVIMRIRNVLEMHLMHSRLKAHNKQLEKSVEERTSEITNLQYELINRLLLAAEFRDDTTGKHIIRIGHYASRLGHLMGLEGSQCEKLNHASMMHDIGKIGIPDEILLKPGKLTDAEFEIMKTHTTKGAEILAGSSSEAIRFAEIIALTHHERWDGTGYPKGLKGDEIPLVGRVTALLDVFDALLMKRPYKEAWELDQVLSYLELHAGSQFDPSIAQVFLSHIDDFLAIRDEFSE